MRCSSAVLSFMKTRCDGKAERRGFRLVAAVLGDLVRAEVSVARRKRQALSYSSVSQVAHLKIAIHRFFRRLSFRNFRVDLY